ncbi:MAG TPA: hypothetical protein VIV66_21995, partial [Pyrinomonadaceae bacterium]
RDPNSYAGILWCFGKHDRAWPERAIFGKLRYMTSRSMSKKFNARGYVAWVNGEKRPPATTELPLLDG